MLNRSTAFLLSLAIATVGATLDYLVQALSSSFSLGVLGGVGGAVVVAAILDVFKGGQSERTPGGGVRYPVFNLMRFNGFHRGVDAFRLGTVIVAIIVGVLAWAAAYLVILGIVTIRYTARMDGLGLGKYSHYDQSAVKFISDFQASTAMFWFAVACAFLAMLTRPPSLVPLTVLAVSLANAVTVRLRPLTRGPVGPRTQLMQFLSEPDARFFRIPDTVLLWGCFGALLASLLVACGMIYLFMSAAVPARR
jgi:hypothetical protein